MCWSAGHESLLFRVKLEPAGGRVICKISVKTWGNLSLCTKSEGDGEDTKKKSVGPTQ